MPSMSCALVSTFGRNLPDSMIEVAEKIAQADFIQYGSELAVRELKRYFLMKIKYADNIIVMNPGIVDQAWHQFILHTKQYREFCGDAFVARFGASFRLEQLMSIADGKRSSKDVFIFPPGWWRI